MTSETPVVDVHAHLLLPALHGEVTRRAPAEVDAAAALDLLRNGAASQAASGPMIGARIPKLTRLDARLEAMDAQGVDRQWVSVSPNHFYPWANEGLAVWIAMETNRLVADHVVGAPDRLTGLGVVPLQHPDRIRECLDDAILGRGLAGVEISSFAGPVYFSPMAVPGSGRIAEGRTHASTVYGPVGETDDDEGTSAYPSSRRTAVSASPVIAPGLPSSTCGW